MANQALVTRPPRPPALSTRARAFARESKAPSTVASYRNAWRDFTEYCEDHGLRALPADPSAVIEYLAEIAARGLKVSTISVRLAAIAEAHRMAHVADPTIDADVKTVMGGIRRNLGVAPDKKEPATLDVLYAMLKRLPGGLTGLRDRAILLIGFGGMFRRSELAALNVEDIQISGSHMRITVRRGKTDQEGKGLVKHYPLLDDEDLCPVRAVQAWLLKSGLKSGPLFRPINRWGKLLNTRLTDKSIALFVKQYAALAGLDAAKYSGHSLRRGGITSAFMAGEDERNVMSQSGHRDPKTVRGYNDDAGQGALDAARAAFGEKRRAP
jgi:integrase